MYKNDRVYDIHQTRCCSDQWPKPIYFNRRLTLKVLTWQWTKSPNNFGKMRKILKKPLDLKKMQGTRAANSRRLTLGFGR
jgi:hypothetical protein